MQKRIEFSGRFHPTPLRALTPGSSYVGVTCHGCGLHVGLFDDISEAEPTAYAGGAQFSVTCAHCGASGDYATADLVQFTAAQGGTTSTS